MRSQVDLFEEYDVVALGELLVDFTEKGMSVQDNSIFEADSGSDMMLRRAEVDVSLLQNTRLFHFGNLSMTVQRAEEATKMAIETAKSPGSFGFL